MAVGLDIDTSLADSAGIEVDERFGGYRVNAELQARSNIWVVRYVATFYKLVYGYLVVLKFSELIFFSNAGIVLE